MPLYDRARNSLERFDLAEIGKKPIGFVCHSLGGLLVKQILRLANEFKASFISRFTLLQFTNLKKHEKAMPFGV